MLLNTLLHLFTTKSAYFEGCRLQTEKTEEIEMLFHKAKHTTK
jgi:hypothetical protein